MVISTLSWVEGKRCNWTNGQPADLVLGQVNFTICTNPTPPTNAGTLSFPQTIALDTVNAKLWVGQNNRILRFDLNNLTTPIALAELVLGQTFFNTSSSGAASQNRVSNPRGMWVDRRGGLWVADAGYSRVMYWNNSAAITNNNALADRVVGQTDFLGGAFATDANRFNRPWGIKIDEQDNLWVADWMNRRALKWTNILTRIDSGQNGDALTADLVLGQLDFLSSSALPPDQGPDQLRGLTIVGNDLYLGDPNHFRLMRWNNAAGLANGTFPSGVLGQTNLTDLTNVGSNTDWRIADPQSLYSDPDGTLYVADSASNRVVFFDNAASKSNHGPASGVIGQADLNANANTCTDSTLSAPSSVALDYDNCQLWIADYSNHRVLRFSGQPDCRSVVCAVGTPLGFDCECQSQISQVIVSFAEDHPVVRLLQAGPGDNSTANSNATVELGVSNLLASGGQLVVLPVSNWTRSVLSVDSAPIGIGGSSVVAWDYTLSTPDSNITMRYLYLPDQTAVQQSSLLPVVQSLGNSIKSAISLSITNPSVLFSSTSDTLALTFNIDYTNLGFPSLATLSPQQTTTSATLYVLRSSRGKVTMQVANQAVADGTVVNIEQVVSVAATNVDDGQIKILIKAPYFASTLQYDPDVSVFFGTSDDEGDGDGGSGDKWWLYLLILAVVPIAAVIVIVVIVTVVVVAVVKKRLSPDNFDTELSVVNYA
jgi:sugar lactone lactonase YvrE